MAPVIPVSPGFSQVELDVCYYRGIQAILLTDAARRRSETGAAGRAISLRMVPV
jgi:hypothetical protein